jgi:hypothetical protein
MLNRLLIEAAAVTTVRIYWSMRVRAASVSDRGGVLGAPADVHPRRAAPW